MASKRGYSLAEIGIVLLFMAILGALGMTALVGSKDKTNESTAKSHLEAAVAVQLNYLQQYGAYATSPDQLADITLDGATYTTTASTSQNQVSVIATPTGIGLAVAADPDTCVATTLDFEGAGPEATTFTTAEGQECTGALASAT